MERALVLLTLLPLIGAAPASADTFAVDRGDDADVSTCSAAPNDCSLRGALTRAGVATDPDTITLPAQRIAVASNLPGIDGTVTIKGAGARSSIIDGTASVSTVLASGFGSSTTLQDLQVTGARRFAHSGGAAVAGAARLERVAILNNESTGLASFGGMTVVDSVIARNTGEIAGGVLASAGATTITNSTVADNTAVAGDSGLLTGPLVFGGGVVNAGALLAIDHSTITGNRLAAGTVMLTGANVGSIAQLDPSTVVRASIIGTSSSGPSCGGPIDSNGHNIDADGSCRFTGAGDRSGVNPRLAPLANNGGPTDTVALLRGSPAIDAGDACPVADQRGVSRTQGTTCDAGAFESPFIGREATPVPDAAAGPPPPDTTAPALDIGGVPKLAKRSMLRRGLKVRVGADEPVGAQLELLVSPRGVRTARMPEVALTRVSLPLSAGARTVSLRARRVPAGHRPVRAYVRVVAYDAAGNRTIKSIRFTIR